MAYQSLTQTYFEKRLLTLLLDYNLRIHSRLAYNPNFPAFITTSKSYTWEARIDECLQTHRDITFRMINKLQFNKILTTCFTKQTILKARRIMLIIAFTIMSAFSVYAYDFSVDGVYYNITSENTCSVTYRSNSEPSYSGTISIPNMVCYNNINYTVTAISFFAMSNCRELESLTIPNTVTLIDSYAFYGCKKLASVSIPSSVTMIKEHAFSGCSSLTSISIPNSVASIGDFAYYQCSGLSSVSIPNSISLIGRSVFEDCSALTTLEIPASVIAIGNSAFRSCISLSVISIPNSVSTIGNYAFYECSNLTSVFIPSSVTSVGDKTFYGCSGLVKSAYPDCLNNPFSNGYSISYPADDIMIDKGVIWGSNKSTLYYVPIDFEGEFILPETVTSIENYAFYGCSHLKWIESKATMPPVIKANTFSNYRIPLIAANSKYKTADYWSNFSTMTYPYTPTGTTFEVDGLKYEIISVNDLSCRLYAIDKSDSENNVTIPEFVEYKGRKFAPIEITGMIINGNSQIKSISIPKCTETISDYSVFNGSLEKLSIHTTIVSDFIRFSHINELVISPDVSEIKSNFKTNRVAKISIENCDVELKTPQFKCDDTEEVFIGRNISEETFYDMSTLKEATVSVSVTSIGKNAFYGCTSLERVNITDLASWCNIHYPNSYSNPTRYAHHLFLDDKEITDLEIPEKVTTIEFASYFGCSELTSLTIPSTVTSIRKSAFADCCGLNSLKFNDGDESIAFGKYAFDSISPREVYFGRQMDFSVVPCTNLRKVEFGKYVKSIAEGTFKDGYAIRTVISYNDVPPTTDDIFANETYLDGTLYVPKNSINAYTNAPGWKNFWEIKAIENDASGIENVIIDETSTIISVDSGAICVSGDESVRIVAMNGATVYSGRGNCSINVAKGIYIVMVGGESHKVVVM
jgi:hypothetical protein